MGCNDVFDYESDLTNPRKGGLEGALLEPKYHAATLWISTSLAAPFVIYLLAVGSVFSGALLLLVIFSVVAYSAKYLRFKEIPVLDSFTSALHFIGPMLFGLALAGTSLMRRCCDYGNNCILPLGHGLSCFWRSSRHKGR